MFAKRPSPEPENKEELNSSSNFTVTESVAAPRPRLVPEDVAQIRDDLASERGNLLPFPPQPSRVQPTWSDYEELFPATEVEPTEPLTELTSAVINRRCYYTHYWPNTTVFRIKDINTENNSVYLNLIYRWVSAAQIQLIQNLKPQRPPQSLELNYLIEPDNVKTDEEFDF